MYKNLKKEDTNQFKFYFSRTIFRYQKQFYEMLFEESKHIIAKKGVIGDIQKATIDIEVSKVLAKLISQEAFETIPEILK